MTPIFQTEQIEKQIEECQTGGKDWILLENFERAKDKEILLRHHAQLEDEFHPGYRLWIITKECKVGLLFFRLFTFLKMDQIRPLFVHFRSIHFPIQVANIQFELYKCLVCFKPMAPLC